MAKKTKKQIVIEKRIKALKKTHASLSKEKRVIQKRLDREDKVKQRKLDALEKVIERLQKKWDKLDEQYLPSTSKSQKIVDKLVTVEGQIRTQEQKLRVITEPPPSDPIRPDREAGDSEE